MTDLLRGVLLSRRRRRSARLRARLLEWADVYPPFYADDPR